MIIMIIKQYYHHDYYLKIMIMIDLPLQEVDILCLIQCSSPFIQPDFLESGYKLLLQVIFVIIQHHDHDHQFINLSMMAHHSTT